MATFEIKTADELIDQDLEARWTARRTARQTDVFQPDGPGPESDGIMLWLGKPSEDRRRVADSL